MPSGPAPLSALVTPLCPGLSVWQKEFAQLRTSSFFLQNAQNLGDTSKDFYLLNPHPPIKILNISSRPSRLPHALSVTPLALFILEVNAIVTFITEHWFLASLDLHLWNCSVLWSWKYISLISDCGDWPTADSAGLWNPSSPRPWEDTLPTGCSSLCLGVAGTWVQAVPGRQAAPLTGNFGSRTPHQFCWASLELHGGLGCFRLTNIPPCIPSFIPSLLHKRQICI